MFGGVPKDEFDELKKWVSEIEDNTRLRASHSEITWLQRDVSNLNSRVRKLEQAEKENTKNRVLSLFDEFTSAYSEDPDVQQVRSLIENATFHDYSNKEG